MRITQKILLKDYQEFHTGTEFWWISKRNLKENTSYCVVYSETDRCLDDIIFKTEKAIQTNFKRLHNHCS